MLSNSCGIRTIANILQISRNTVLSALTHCNHPLLPRKTHYECLEIDELWTFVQNKQCKVWIIYAYSRADNEIIAYVWGKRDYETANKLRNKIKALGIHYHAIATDKWDSFEKAFSKDNHIFGKKYTIGIEGNNNRLRHMLSRLFRKSGRFSKKIENHIKALNLGLFYINHRHVGLQHTF